MPIALKREKDGEKEFCGYINIEREYISEQISEFYHVGSRQMEE